jgi:D-alanine-D-alanine ligase
MDGNGLDKEGVFCSTLRSVHSIGVVFCTARESARGREIEKLADCEVVDVAFAVKDALTESGYVVDLIDLSLNDVQVLQQYDWVFNLAETIDGFPLNDFEVAEKMEEMGIRFTGSGSASLKACLNKAVTKQKLIKNNFLTPIYDVFSSDGVCGTQCQFPVIVKPVHEDGSIGISSDSIAWNVGEMNKRIERILDVYHQPALVEEYIDGRDITAAIIGNGKDAIVMPLSEIIYASHVGPKFLTFAGKWVEDSLDFQYAQSCCPCELERNIETMIKHTALQAFSFMNCRDYARVDFRLRGATPYVLEVNPNPCINPHDSGFVRSGKAGGYSYEELIRQILSSSIKNYSYFLPH